MSASEDFPRSRRGAAEATRERLLIAGRAAFARKGLAGTSLKADILEPAGISVGSFYHQFKDKTELLLAILDEYSDRFRARLRDVHRPGPGRTLLEIARDSYGLVFEIAERESDLLRIQLRERDSDDARVREFLRRDRERWVRSLTEDYELLAEASGVPVASDGAAELTAALAMGAVSQLLDLPPEKRPGVRDRLLEHLVRFTAGGLPALAYPDAGSDAGSLSKEPAPPKV